MSQLFGMDNAFSTLTGKYENKINKETKPTTTKSTIGTPKLSETASSYYDELKSKYSDVAFVLVDDAHAGSAKEHASDITTDKSMIVLISEDEVEQMATDETTRKKNESIIEDARAQMPDLLKQLKESGTEVKAFGIEFDDNGTASYFAVVDKSMAAQKERIENKVTEKRAEEKKAQKKDEQTKNNVKKEDLTTVTASSMEELIKKIKDVMYEAKADSVLTEQEKLVGQKFDFSL